MKKNILFLIAAFLFTSTLQAQAVKRRPAQAKVANPYNSGVAYFKKKDYRNAAVQFYKVIFQSRATANQQASARYHFGISLMKLGLHQTAAFPLLMSTQNTPPKISQKAFENLVLISEKMGDTTLLDFTLKRLDVGQLSEIGKELYFNRMAEVLMREKKYPEALQNVAKALQMDPNSEESLYLGGLINLKAGKVAEGVPYFEKIYDKYYSRPATDRKRGLAALALGRAYYQAKRWEDAINVYRQIPKDHLNYRESQLELSWSLFRAGKFRSAMSTTQTLHTPFYENYYDPESLILRAIILLFVCQADEADKALQTFERTYLSTYNVVADINSSNNPPDFYYRHIDQAQNYLKGLKGGTRAGYTGTIPFFLVRSTLAVTPLKNQTAYMDKVQQEKERLGKVFKGPGGQVIVNYATKILDQRLKNSQKEAGNSLQQSLIAKEQEMSMFAGDLSLLRYEVLNGKKQEARSKYIQNVNNKEGANQIDANEGRDFYVQNGYRYWPFEGEFWRDEIGNYQYLGVNRCDQEN